VGGVEFKIFSGKSQIKKSYKIERKSNQKKVNSPPLALQQNSI
jgi:hypothetical protein